MKAHVALLMTTRWYEKSLEERASILAKKRATFTTRYGVDHPWKAPEVQDQMRVAWVLNYGVDNPMKSEMIQEKARQTCLRNHGVEYPAQDPAIYAKTMKGLHDVKEIVHWKTGEALSCRASYELTFVNWCNANQIDFDWQIPFKTPILTSKGHASVYFIDAYVKSGLYADTWIELKGTFNRKNGHVGLAKWDWFHAEHPNSELWTRDVLKQRTKVQRPKIHDE